MSNANDFIESFRITNQNPLDAKTYKESEEALKDLGSSNNLAYTYGQGLLVYCVAEGTRWEWREPDGAEVGLLEENFVYPNGFTADYKDYSNKAFNFFVVRPLSTQFQKATDTISGVVKTDITVFDPVVYVKETVDMLLSNKLTKLAPITAGIKTKISYNTDGLVTAGTDATTADILSVSNSRYVTDSDLIKLSNTSGINTGDNANNTTSNTYADSKIENQIVTGVTTKGASQAIIYTNLLLKEDISNKGIADGYVPLDSNTKIPLIYINDSLLGNVSYQGLWNQSTNMPNLDIVKPKGHYYICSGLTETTRYGLIFNTGDWIISNGITWDKVDNTDAVSSIFGRTGNIIAQSGDYTTDLITETINKNYQTDNQKLYNDATSSIQTQLNSKQPLINTVNLGTQDIIPKFGALGLINSSITDSGTLVSTTSRLTIGTGIPIETNIWVTRDITGGTSCQSILVEGVIKADVTTAAYLNRTKAFTEVASFTLSNLYHYHARQETFGAGSTVTNQYGFFSESTLIGATNNYGFYGDIPTGANRWNLYMNGTAPNYFNGAVGIGTNAPLGRLNVVTGTGSAINIALQPSASVVIGNLGTGGNEMPVISGRTSNNTGLTLLAASAEVNTTPDMRFEIRENDNTDFTDRTTPGFRFTRFGTNLIEILRNGNTTFIGSVTASSLILNSVLKLKAYTFATLPTGAVGDMVYITDALAPTYNGTLVGGGTVKIPVFHDGTAWKTH